MVPEFGHLQYILKQGPVLDAVCLNYLISLCTKTCLQSVFFRADSKKLKLSVSGVKWPLTPPPLFHPNNCNIKFSNKVANTKKCRTVLEAADLFNFEPFTGHVQGPEESLPRDSKTDPTENFEICQHS